MDGLITSKLQTQLRGLKLLPVNREITKTCVKVHKTFEDYFDKLECYLTPTDIGCLMADRQGEVISAKQEKVSFDSTNNDV